MSTLLYRLQFVRAKSLVFQTLRNPTKKVQGWQQCCIHHRLLSSNDKQKPVEFSKTETYPTKTTLEKTIGVPYRLVKNKSFLNVILSFALPVSLICFAFYVFFLSSFDPKMEEKMGEVIPGYERHMNVSSEYREKMAESRALEKRREMAKKKQSENKEN